MVDGDGDGWWLMVDVAGDGDGEGDGDVNGDDDDSVIWVNLESGVPMGLVFGSILFFSFDIIIIFYSSKAGR